MPELPEVETTVRGLRQEVLGRKILAVWTDLKTKDKRKKDTVANPKYFRYFQKEVVGKKIISAERRAKNILVNLSGNRTILVHLKMTGYLFVGPDPKIKFAHVIFTLSDPKQSRASKKYLVFSDARKFGKMAVLNTQDTHDSKHLKDLGPEPLEKQFTITNFKLQIKTKPNGKIKTVLMDQSVVVGIGNIYSDEILWLAGIHPARKVSKITEAEFQKIFQAMKKTLVKGIDLGGDSMSDYKNIYGEKGNFQMHHNAYRRTGEKCKKKGCPGIIKRLVIGSRSAHFCTVHQR